MDLVLYRLTGRLFEESRRLVCIFPPYSQVGFNLVEGRAADGSLPMKDWRVNVVAQNKKVQRDRLGQCMTTFMEERGLK